MTEANVQRSKTKKQPIKMVNAGDGDAASALAAALRQAIRGEVRFDRGSRALYATDASNYRETPIGVALPRDKEDVIEAVAVCRRHGAPILGRGGGASLAGQGCNTAVILDFSKYMNEVLWIDAEQRLARVQPGVVLDVLQGENYNPWEPVTTFRFPEDDFSFSRATLRCVGVGKCRREEGGAMCPSYKVAREEAHSTRGRARLLFEMLQGDAIKDRWQDENVKEALDLCLSCKGCKGDCPVNVDVATYKAEFLSHYYREHLRPRSAFAFGLIHWWARLASLLPGVANFFTQTSGFSPVAKWIADVAPERRIPSFARQTFKAWFRERPSTDYGMLDLAIGAVGIFFLLLKLLRRGAAYLRSDRWKS